MLGGAKCAQRSNNYNGRTDRRKNEKEISRGRFVLISIDNPSLKSALAVKTDVVQVKTYLHCNVPLCSHFTYTYIYKLHNKSNAYMHLTLYSDIFMCVYTHSGRVF